MNQEPMRLQKGTETAWCDTCVKKTKQRTTTREIGRLPDQPMPIMGVLATKYTFERRYKCLSCGKITTKEKDSYRTDDDPSDLSADPFS